MPLGSKPAGRKLTSVYPGCTVSGNCAGEIDMKRRIGKRKENLEHLIAATPCTILLPTAFSMGISVLSIRTSIGTKIEPCERILPPVKNIGFCRQLGQE
jgi:hypothetical protein